MYALKDKTGRGYFHKLEGVTIIYTSEPKQFYNCAKNAENVKRYIVDANIDGADLKTVGIKDKG